MAGKTRELALFNPAIDSKLRGCDLVALRVRDIAHGNHVIARAGVVRHKTREPVRFELTDQTRGAVQAWIKEAALSSADFLFPSRQSGSPHLSARQ
jgi:integrase